GDFSSCVSPDPQYKGETAIVGRIKKEGAPVAGAFIRLLDQGKEFVGEVRSDDSGDFHFFAGAGQGAVVGLAPGPGRVWRAVLRGSGRSAIASRARPRSRTSATRTASTSTTASSTTTPTPAGTPSTRPTSRAASAGTASTPSDPRKTRCS